ncbi:mfs transporter [Diplodia corticola]|uniref:Mfs transporter n=1 Tax=Diplodia corticola TaxID=236234 RepID=A0A1J9R6X2_9PEZI|nr:mfs transporter [Diplodia corticola]OJD35970.1 mfs transporter [Diplodia corticola]
MTDALPTSSHGLDEQSPLLPRHPAPSTPKAKWSPAAISYLFLLVIVVGVAADAVSTPALTRIYESIYCRRYFAEHDPSLIGRDGRDSVPEELCKVPKVQGEVAMLKAWQTFFDAVGGISFAIPWGWYADSRGRKPVLLLTTYSLLARAIWIQIVCLCWKTLSLRLVWLSAIHSVSGGAPVFSALAYVVIADVTPQQERGAMFFRFGASQLFATFISSPLAAFLMRLGLFVPTIAGTVFYGLMCALVSLIPETKGYSSTKPPSRAGPFPPVESSTMRERIRKIPAHVRDSAAFLWSDRRISILVLVYSVHSLVIDANELLIQYISAHFAVSLSHATLVLAFQSALIIVHLLFVLPAITHFLTARLGMAVQLKDLYLARWSALFLSLGLLGIGIAPTLLLLITAIPFEVAGWGFTFVVRSLMTSFVESHHVARLYTVLTLVDTAVLMVGSPVTAALFDRGMSSGDGSTAGLPYVVCSLLVAVFGVLVLFVRIEGELPEEAVDGDEVTRREDGHV